MGGKVVPHDTNNPRFTSSNPSMLAFLLQAPILDRMTRPFTHNTIQYYRHRTKNQTTSSTAPKGETKECAARPPFQVRAKPLHTLINY